MTSWVPSGSASSWSAASPPASGSTVELTRGPADKGTLATVRMPLVLFVDPQSIPLTAPTEHGKVETFILPEEAAAAQHDTAFAPVPTGVQDVAPGQYGSAENPAEEVDIAALVEGTTELGLPKRRSHGDAPPSWSMSGGDTASASAIPLAPAPEALAGAASSSTGDVWQPPVMQTSSPLPHVGGPTPLSTPRLLHRPHFRRGAPGVQLRSADADRDRQSAAVGGFGPADADRDGQSAAVGGFGSADADGDRAASRRSRSRRSVARRTAVYRPAVRRRRVGRPRGTPCPPHLQAAR